MNNAFEHTVLAYLDGLLDRREEHAFLREVARDPKKRALLEDYRKLNTMLKDRSVPISVPLRTQRALAARLPALKEVVPDAAPPATLPAGNGITSFFSRRLVSMLAGGIFVATVGSILLTDPFSSADHIPSDADNATTSAIQAVASGTTTPVTPAEDLQADNASLRESQMQSAATDRSGIRTLPDAEWTSPADRTMRTRSSASSATGFATGQHSGEKALSGDAVADLTAYPSPAQWSGDEAALMDMNTGTEFALPLRHIPVFDATGNDAHTIRQHPHSSLLPDILDGRLYAYIETGAARQEMRGSGAQVRDMFRGLYIGGIRYDFSPAFSAGLEVGQSMFAREMLVASRSSLESGTGTEIILIDRSMQDELLPWLRLHGVYTLNPGSLLQVQGDAGAGLLLGSDRTALFSFGVSTVYPLAYGVKARAGIHYSGTWLQPSGDTPRIDTGGSGVIGIIRRADRAGTVYASSIEFRIGFGILLW